MANGDAAPADASPPPAPVDTPYNVTNHDGSTSTYVWHTDRTPTVPEVANYAKSQGQNFAGLLEQPAEQAPAAAAPS